MTTIELAHAVEVVTDGFEHRAVRSCGWASFWTDDAAAEAAAEDHREVAVEPGDGVDRMLGELLDVQRDLGDICVWLAGCWSEDLPEPYISAGSPTRGTLAEVHVQPRNREELDRIAALIDAPVGPDVAEGYVAARRRFGRCELAAWLRVTDRPEHRCEECEAPVDGDACSTCGQRIDADVTVVLPDGSEL